MKEIKSLKEKAKSIRKQIINISEKAKTGHVTSSFSCVEILVALFYGKILRYDSQNPAWSHRDRFILSKGQASLILYPILADLGFFPKEELEHFCGTEGKFGVHLQHDVPGAEITSGSLGVGFGVAAGIASAMKNDQREELVVSLLGDGECYEGAIWETAMYAGHQKLHNLIAIIDRNYLCATDFTENIITLEPMEARWSSFGWEVIRIDGHNFEEILSALEGVRDKERTKPLAIIADTIKGKGVSFITDQPFRHGTALIGQEAQDALAEIEKEET